LLVLEVKVKVEGRGSNLRVEVISIELWRRARSQRGARKERRLIVIVNC